MLRIVLNTFICILCSILILLFPYPVSSLNLAIETLKDQSKTKMIAAIEKMKELKNGFNTKVEEVNAGNVRISELEQSLLLSNQDALKYKGAMEKAVPKFRDLKVELDEKSQEIIRIQNDNADLKNKLLLEMNRQKSPNKEHQQQLIRGKSEGEEILDGHEVESQRFQSLSGLSEEDSNAALSSTKDIPMSNIHPSAIELTALVAELRVINQDIKVKAELTETSLRLEIDSLSKVGAVCSSEPVYLLVGCINCSSIHLARHLCICLLICLYLWSTYLSVRTPL